MGQGFDKVLGALYQRIPPAARPFFKSVYVRAEIRLRALLSGRPIRRGKRITFLDFEIAYLEDCEYLGPGRSEVEVVARSSTVSPGTERAVLCGLPGARRDFPYYPGYSCAGQVVKVGSDVREYRVGDRVAGRAKHVSGDSVATDLLFPIPENVNYEAASFIELGIIVLQGVRKAAIRPGDRIAVLGQGLIGQLATRVARAAGAGTIIAMAQSRNRAATAVAAGGADFFVETGSPEFSPDSIDADVVIEAVGTPDAIALAARCTRAGGRVVLLGSSRGLSRDVDLAQLLRVRGVEIVGAHISNMPTEAASPGRHTYRQEGRLFLDLLRTGRVRVDDLVTWHPAPRECNAVYEMLAKGGGSHVAIVFDWC